MKMVVEYLEQAREFEHLADETTDAEVKARMLEQAEGYRKLADERAVRLKITTPFKAAGLRQTQLTPAAGAVGVNRSVPMVRN
jgi:hypothetical protein